MPVSFPLLSIGAAPTDGVDEVQLLTPTPTISGGTFTLTFDGQTTSPAIDWDATIAEIQAALEALSTIGEGNVVCTGDDPDPEVATQLSDGGVITITFAGALAGFPQPEHTANAGSLTGAGHALTPSTSVAGVRGTYRGAQSGVILEDNVNGVIYQNTGTAQTPVWADLGA